MGLACQLCAASIERDSFPFIRLSGERAALVAPARFIGRRSQFYLANDRASEWAARARRALKFCEIQANSPEPDPAKAEAYFERALTVSRQQQAKSWELRAATSLARLRRDQGNPHQARELLAPVYGWFTEGFDTRDLKEAKALLEGLTA